MKALRYIVFNCALGWVSILASRRGLMSTTLPQPSYREAERQLGISVREAIWSPDQFADLVERFKAYFNDDRITFPDELDLTAATAFQCRVWQIARLIPYGETRSYRWVAEQIGKPAATRAVGQALAKNPLPIIIPCYRVVSSDGKLGGFSGGMEMKRFLLWLEASR